jgi:hypothetical protein
MLGIVNNDCFIVATQLLLAFLGLFPVLRTNDLVGILKQLFPPETSFLPFFFFPALNLKILLNLAQVSLYDLVDLAWLRRRMLLAYLNLTQFWRVLICPKKTYGALVQHGPILLLLDHLKDVKVGLLGQVIARLNQFWHIHLDVKHWQSQFVPDQFLGIIPNPFFFADELLDGTATSTPGWHVLAQAFTVARSA